MSEADKMFEELGYEKTYDDNTVITYEAIKNNVQIILNDKSFLKEDWGTASDISMEELKAINKKCNELGWL